MQKSSSRPVVYQVTVEQVLMSNELPLFVWLILTNRRNLAAEGEIPVTNRQ